MNYSPSKNTIRLLDWSFGAILFLSFMAGWQLPAWDDALFYKRISFNILSGHGPVWNISESPVYGITSQGFLLFSTLLLSLTENYYLTAVRIISYLALWISYIWLRKISDSNRSRAVVLFAFFQMPVLFMVASSAMETAVVIALIAAFVAQLEKSCRSEASEWKEKAILISRLAGWNTLIYIFRPDAVLLTGLVTAAFLFQKKRNLLPLFLFAGVLSASVVLTVFYFWYGSAFPTAWALKLKGASIYGAHFLRTSEPDRFEHAFVFVLLCAPAFWLLFRNIYRRIRYGENMTGLEVPVLIFFGYHFFATIDVMGMAARFYLPAFPILAYILVKGQSRIGIAESPRILVFQTLAICAFGIVFLVAYFKGFIPNHAEDLFDRLTFIEYGIYFVLLLAAFFCKYNPKWVFAVILLLAVSRPVLQFGSMPVNQKPAKKLSPPPDRVLVRRGVSRVTTTRGIWVLKKCRPKPKAICHSEIGAVGILFPETRVVDFAGIMMRPTPTSSEALVRNCKNANPEAIFLPHRNYRKLRKVIERQALLDDYVTCGKKIFVASVCKG